MSTVFRVGDPVVVVDAADNSVIKFLDCTGDVVRVEGMGLYDVGVHFHDSPDGYITDCYDFELAIDEARLLEDDHGQV